MLINSAKLVQLWTDNIPRLSDQAWQRLPLTPIYFLTPEGYGTMSFAMIAQRRKLWWRCFWAG